MDPLKQQRVASRSGPQNTSFSMQGSVTRSYDANSATHDNECHPEHRVVPDDEVIPTAQPGHVDISAATLGNGKFFAVMRASC